MSNNESERIRENIRRYQALLEVTTDARAQEALKELIGELEARLGGFRPALNDLERRRSEPLVSVAAAEVRPRCIGSATFNVCANVQA